MAALLSALICSVASAVGADTYYSLEMDQARLTPKGIAEDGRVYPVQREGSGARARLIKDRNAGSTVLVLDAGATPQGALKDRSELRIYSGITFNRTWFLGLRVKVRGEVEPDAWHLLMQCHQAGTKSPPPLSLNLETGNRFSLIARSSEDAYERLWTGAMPQGRWMDIVIAFRMGAKGHVQLWTNGKRVSAHRVPLRWAGHAERCVLKTGIYRAASDRSFQIRLDDIRLGDSYEDVAR